MKSCFDSRRCAALLCVALISIAGAAAAAGEETARAEAPAAKPQKDPVAQGIVSKVPLADLAGARREELAPEIENPRAGNKEAINNGRKLFSTMNCAGCHGYDAKGGMGPDLTDTFWLYGGTPVMVYKSIYEGRPQGMPAWLSMLPHEVIWDVVAYIQSLGGTFPADKYEAALQGDLGKGLTRHAEKGASPDTRGRR
jgi:cytochrome c oxidase cbb3-type subunit III